jgi:hypothetical protein
MFSTAGMAVANVWPLWLQFREGVAKVEMHVEEATPDDLIDHNRAGLFTQKRQMHCGKGITQRRNVAAQGTPRQGVIYKASH